MFEDSTFESTGSIHTRSRRWMFATLALNSAVVVALILFPLLYPDALPRATSAILMVAPAPQQETQPPPQRQMTQVPRPTSEMMSEQLKAPPRIPVTTYIPSKPEPPAIEPLANWDMDSTAPGNGTGIFRERSKANVVREAQQGPARISSGVMEGLLIQKIMPEYPPLAQTMHVEGTVVLQASITRDGRIANLRVVSGPALLQRAAVEAVSRWRYRPYLLNGEPVEVETTVNVRFSLH